MSEIEINEEHHVSRYCRPLCIGASGLPLGCAFQLRDKEGYLSVNWLEYYNESDLVQAMGCVRQVFQKKGYKIARSGKFASLQVNKMKAVISSHSSKSFRAKHIPTSKDPSHTGIFGYTASDKLIALKISELVCSDDMHPTVL